MEKEFDLSDRDIERIAYKIAMIITEKEIEFEEWKKEAVRLLNEYFMDTKTSENRISILPSEYRAIINKIFGDKLTGANE